MYLTGLTYNVVLVPEDFDAAIRYMQLCSTYHLRNDVQ